MEIPKLSLDHVETEAGVGIIKQYSVAETYPLHTHDFFEIFFISRGKGIHCINGKQQVLSNGSLVFIRPEDVHSFEAFNYFDFEMFSIGFTDRELKLALKYLELSISDILQSELPIHIRLEGNRKIFFEQQLEEMMTWKDCRERRKLFRVVLSQVLYYIMRHNGASTEKEVLPAWLSVLDGEMSKKENYIAGLPRMMELCGYSQEHVNRMFKKYFKMTPTEYINARRMTYAAELLVSRRYEIIDICDMSGFNNLSHFYAVFKKQYQCTPFQFLKSFTSL